MCRHCWHCRLSLCRPAVPPGTKTWHHDNYRFSVYSFEEIIISSQQWIFHFDEISLYCERIPVISRFHFSLFRDDIQYTTRIMDTVRVLLCFVVVWYHGPIAWISNHMASKVWGEIIYPFPNFNGTTVEVWEWISNFIPHFIMDVITYPCWD